MPKNKKLKVAFIGGGIIGKNTSPLYNTDKSEVTDVLRRDSDKAKEFAKTLNAKAHSAPNLSKKEIGHMLKQPFDLAVLAMIPGVQKDIALQCAEYGKPLYAEKMFTRSYDEAQEVVQAYKDKKLPLFVAHFCRCMPQIQCVKKLIADNTIGEIKRIQMDVQRQYNENALKNKKWMQDPELSGGGWFTDLGPHYMDALIYLFGDLDITESRVQQTFDKYPQLEDKVDLAFKTKDGAEGKANFDFNSDKWGDNVIVEGENGSISFKVLGRDSSVIITDTYGQESSIDFKNEPLMQAPMIRKIIDALYHYRCGNKTLEQIEEEAITSGLCTGQEALKSSRIVSNVISKFQEQKRGSSFLSRIDARDNLSPRIPIKNATEGNKEVYR